MEDFSRYGFRLGGFKSIVVGYLVRKLLTGTSNTVRVIKMKAVQLASGLDHSNVRLWRLTVVGACPSSTTHLISASQVAWLIQRSLGRVNYNNQPNPRASIIPFYELSHPPVYRRKRCLHNAVDLTSHDFLTITLSGKVELLLQIHNPGCGAVVMPAAVRI